MPAVVRRDTRQIATIKAEENDLDLVCIGFGPASLAIAVALHDKGVKSRVRYLERQHEFVWHSGMLIPGARMQISFLKDLATMRDPRSHFTFLNYLRHRGRLVAFTNLSTFLPLREEYNDYLKWCASYFEEDVGYNQNVVDITPVIGAGGLINSWQVRSKHTKSGKESLTTTRHAVIAVGGTPQIPEVLMRPSPSCAVIHSSSYTHMISTMLREHDAQQRIAIIGGGQSAAEIYQDLQQRSKSVKVHLYIKDSALRPSDDSPL